MRAAEFQRILRTQPFEPIRVHLSDGRSVLIRHPDQVVVSQRHLYVGLGTSRSRALSTPKDPNAITSDFLWVNLIQVTTVEPANGTRRAASKTHKRSS